MEPCALEITGWEAPEKAAPAEQSESAEGQSPAQMADKLAAEIGARYPLTTSAYQTVRSMEELQGWIEEAKRIGHVAVDTETNSLDAMQADLVGVSLATEPGKACYIPLTHSKGDGDMFDGGLG